MSHILRAQRSVTLLRGRLGGLEVALSGRDLGEGLAELEARLAEQPSFYRGSTATASFGPTLPSPEYLERLRAVLATAGIDLRAVRGWAGGLNELASTQGLHFEDESVRLSDSARSLVADFAGARSDIAQRRKRGESSVRRAKVEPQRERPPELRLVDAAPGTLYHAATLRGGQTLHHAGNIVVVGDVNPGAELIAGGDILVFGRLTGIAHAGAQGDDRARIYALDLAATQLRIATLIAAEDGEAKPRGAPKPEAAVARDGKIVVLALDSLADLATGASSA
ncbi:MAG: septum site-determining protein MinC [Candidatus Eremiobacteraeota bacterium]|nr:septum site-determining protein MinC [Candidatus Eremiobacteraeota bacterium]